MRIAYRSRDDATSETELNVLANVYAYLIKSHHNKKAAKPVQLRMARQRVRCEGRRLRCPREKR